MTVKLFLGSVIGSVNHATFRRAEFEDGLRIGNLYETGSNLRGLTLYGYPTIPEINIQ